MLAIDLYKFRPGPDGTSALRLTPKKPPAIDRRLLVTGLPYTTFTLSPSWQNASTEFRPQSRVLTIWQAAVPLIIRILIQVTNTVLAASARRLSTAHVVRNITLPLAWRFDALVAACLLRPLKAT